MRHHSALFAENAPPSQPSPSNSIPHRKKKRKHRPSPVVNNPIQETTDSVSISSEPGRTSCYANGRDELNSHVHCAVIACEEMPSPKPLRQRSLSSGGGFGDSAVTAVGDGYGKEGSSVGVATSDMVVEPLELKRVLTEDSICE